MSDVIVGLDIGTSVIRAVIGEVDENGEFHVDGNAFDIKTKGGAFHRSDPKKSLDLKLRGFFD